MILKSHITEWAKFVPWQQAYQIEQDLILSKALVDIYRSDELSSKLAFRGGTALNKLYFHPASRYSEDLDFVQISAGPIGGVVDILNERLSWLGAPQRKFSEGRVTLTYKVLADDNTPIKIKIEINSREHFAVLGFDNVPFHVGSSWVDSTCQVTTYKLEELLGTKLRALYQRKKGRDLFDLYFAMMQYPQLDLSKIVECFKRYMTYTANAISSKTLITNIELKLQDEGFRQDIMPLLPNQHSGYSSEVAFDAVMPLLMMV
jgi:predicted nucleotidyltransferase component of viral defense system